MKQLLDNKELEELLQILENMENEDLAVKLLAKLNKATKELGTLVMNREASVKHEEWKEMCDQARRDVDEVVAEIRRLGV